MTTNHIRFLAILFFGFFLVSSSMAQGLEKVKSDSSLVGIWITHIKGNPYKKLEFDSSVNNLTVYTISGEKLHFTYILKRSKLILQGRKQKIRNKIVDIDENNLVFASFLDIKEVVVYTHIVIEKHVAE
jgi:hypothetical protein